MDSTSLENLHDIVLPAAPSIWPLAPGVWLVLMVAALLGLAAWKYSRQSKQKNAYRLAGSAALLQANTVYEVSVVLKRVALAAWPRDKVASLCGQDWVEFLNGSCPGARFQDGCWEASAAAPGQQLIAAADLWIRRHRVA